MKKLFIILFFIPVLYDTSTYSAMGWHEAAKNGDITKLEHLIDTQEGNINKLNNKFATPLHYAALGNSNEAISLLLKHGAWYVTDKPDKNGSIPLHVAAKNAPKEIISTLLKYDPRTINQCDNDGNTPLHIAAHHGNIDAIQILLENGAQEVINAINIFGDTPLHKAAEAGSEDIIRLLFENGADINCPTFGRTSLHSAAQYGNANIISIFLEHGGLDIINQIDENGDTPLHYAASRFDVYQNNNAGAIEILLQNGALEVINQPDHRGCLPLNYIISTNNTVFEDEDDDTYSLLYNHGAIANTNLPEHSETSNDYTSLHLAASNNNVDAISSLLKNDALPKINYTDVDSQTPLRCAILYNSINAIRLLLKNGASFNWSDLEQAARNGDISVIRILLENGGLNIINEESTFCPLWTLVDNNHTDTDAKKLLQFCEKIPQNAPREMLAFLMATHDEKQTDSNSYSHKLPELVNRLIYDFVKHPSLPLR